MAPKIDYGHTDFIVFTNARERLLWIAISRLFFALRFSSFDSENAADWGLVLYRVLRYPLDDDLKHDAFLRKVAQQEHRLRV